MATAVKSLANYLCGSRRLTLSVKVRVLFMTVVRQSYRACPFNIPWTMRTEVIPIVGFVTNSINVVLGATFPSTSVMVTGTELAVYRHTGMVYVSISNTFNRGWRVKAVKNLLGIVMATSFVIIRFTISYPFTLRTTLIQLQCSVLTTPLPSATGALSMRVEARSLLPLPSLKVPINAFFSRVAIKVVRGCTTVKGKFTSEQAVTTELTFARGAVTRNEAAVFPEVFLWCSDTVAGSILYEYSGRGIFSVVVQNMEWKLRFERQ